MEHELQALRVQLAEKSKHSLQLQKEVYKMLHFFLTNINLENGNGFVGRLPLMRNENV